MAQSDNDDLFRHTSMTFGEHLEELRVSLFKAVLSLAVGFGIGLWMAPTIVQWIQSPLEIALKGYYSQEAIEYFNAHVPATMRDNEAAKNLVLKEGLEPIEVYLAPDDLVKELKRQYPDFSADLKLPKSASSQTTDAADSQVKDSGTVAGASAPSDAKADMIRFFLWKPLADDDRLKLESFNVQESFMIYIKAAFLAGALISSPLVFYFLWSFVAAGLYPHEKRYVHFFLPFSVALFLCGAAMAFFFVFPPVLSFFFGITKSMGQGLRPRISEWLSFVLMLPLGFGISFQLPLVMLFLARIHIFTPEVYLAKWRIAVLLMAVASMVLSPGGDPYSMLMMLLPLVGLYFGGIALCKWLPNGGGLPSKS